MIPMVNKNLRLLVVIINYKTPKLVCDALESLVGQLDIACDSVVVIDNDSRDNSVSTIKQFLQLNQLESWVKIVESEVNGGFSAGNNLGMQFFQADYYLLLNSDAFVRMDALKSLLVTAEKNLKAGVICPRLEWPDGSQQVSCFYNLSPANSFLQSAKTGVFTKLFGFFGSKEVAVPLVQHNIEQPEWLSFACVLLRGKMVREIGLMDEGYFMYREDNDYCRRAINAGWKLKFEPKSRVVHLNNGSSNQSGVKRLPKFYFNSRARYFLKYYGRLGLLQANIFWCAGRCISSLREMVSRKPKAFHSTMWADIWIGFFSKQEYDGK